MKGQTELDVMGVSQPTIDAAFERHRQRYAQRPRRAWDIPHHIECWRRAHRAFAEGAFDDFQWLYEGLKGYWQVFRGSKGKPWSARQVYDHLIELDKPVVSAINGVAVGAGMAVALPAPVLTDASHAAHRRIRRINVTVLKQR